MSCPHCGEDVEPGERSDLVYVLGDGPTLVHWECAARSALGSVGHQQGKCSCYGGTEEDPPGLTKREAALAAYAYANGKGTAA